jgi:hypothetical protein
MNRLLSYKAQNIEGLRIKLCVVFTIQSIMVTLSKSLRWNGKMLKTQTVILVSGNSEDIMQI